MSCFINRSLFTQVLSLYGCWTFLKANKSLGFRTCCSSFWTCALGAGGPLNEVFCTGSAFTCTESAFFPNAAFVAGAEGVVVLEGVASLGTEGNVLESYWHCTALCLFCMSFIIWNTFTYHSVFCSLYCSLCSHRIYHLMYCLMWHSLLCLHSFY